VTEGRGRAIVEVAGELASEDRPAPGDLGEARTLLAEARRPDPSSL